MFTHLHVHSCFSFLDGGSRVAALVDRARECGYRALALTDHNGLYGAVRFQKAAAEAGLKPIHGVELALDEEFEESLRTGDFPPPEPPEDEPVDPFMDPEPPQDSLLTQFEPGRVHYPHGNDLPPRIVLLARNRQGFRNLCRIITDAQLSHEKGNPRLSPRALHRFRDGLFCLSGGERGPVAGALLAGRREAARRAVEWFRVLFGPEQFFVEVQQLLHPHSAGLLRDLTGLARELNLRAVATNSVHYARKADFPVHDVLVCCQTLTTVDERHPARPRNAEAYLKSASAMRRLFAGYEEALEMAGWIAEQCEPGMELGVYHFPDFPIPEGETAYSYLCKLCWDGTRARYQVITREVVRRLEHELDVIEGLGFAQYFLIMWDIVRWARERGILCAGRGSAADSIVTYVLGITEVDPIAHNLLFERFLNPERKGAPDIDIDFDASRRDEVINYVYERYGREHAAMVCTVVTMNARLAIREIGKALDFPPEDIDRFAKAMPHTGADRIRGAIENLPELRDSSLPVWKFEALLDLCEKVAGFPRHLGVHLGGMVVSKERLDELAPLEWSAKGVVVTQWDKDDIEEVGLVKMDLLSLKNLAAIEAALRLIANRHRGTENTKWENHRAHRGHREEKEWTADGMWNTHYPTPTTQHPTRTTPSAIRHPQLDIDHLPLDDPAVYELLRTTHTVGLFQLESPGMRGLLGRLQPERFEDIIAQISLFRPGPLTADMINPFIARRHGEEPITYLHPKLEPIMRSTYGVLLYQEQVLEIAAALAGFDYGQADALRRAMTTDRSPAEMEKLRESFLDGCAAQGDVAPEVAERVWKALSSFAAYGFCKAHAAAFAKTAYQTAWLKAHYPAEFFCGILNNQPMGFYSGHTIVQEAKRLGIPVLPVDINRSEGEFTVEGGCFGST